MYCFLAVHKLLSLIKFYLFLFLFITLEGESKGSCCDLCQIVLPVFSCKSFIVSGLTLRPLMQVVVQFSQYCLLKRPSSPLYILASFVLDYVTIGVWVYLWASYLVPMVYISVFMPVPYCLDDCSSVV